MIVTPRWFPLPDHVMAHPIQTELLNSESQYNVVAAGRRSFKTERFLKRAFVYHACTEFGKQFFLGAPTRPQAKHIFWRDVIDLSPSCMVADVNKTDLCIEYVTGTRLFVVGLQEFQRVEGIRWDRVGITEFQHTSPDFFPRTLQPILNDTRGYCIMEGRPLGKNHFYDFYCKGERGEPGWRSFTWTSEEVLSSEQIEQAKNDLAIEDYRREYLADFESGGQRTYYAYTVSNHAQRAFNSSLPVALACDFNATECPLSWTVLQFGHDGAGWAHAFKSFSHTYTNTEQMLEKVVPWLRERGVSHILLYGDYSGSHRTSNSSRTDWQIITTSMNNAGITTEKRYRPCRSIRDRVAATNAMLRNSNDAVRLTVDPVECKPLIEDWERVQWKDNGVDLDGTDKRRTHNSDSVDYFTMVEFPSVTQTTIRG